MEAQGCYQTEDIVRLYRNIKMRLGVSATHLDWTMVPYVRKSFWKHYKDGLLYCEDKLFDTAWNCDSVSIESKEYKEYPKAYKYAMDMTSKEVYQAVEGMFHNLNTLQSRSGNQLKVVAG